MIKIHNKELAVSSRKAKCESSEEVDQLGNIRKKQMKCFTAQNVATCLQLRKGLLKKHAVTHTAEKHLRL